METNPSEDFMRRELDRLINLQECIVKTFADPISAHSITTNVVKNALKNAGKPNLPEQIKTIKFILQLD